MKVILPGGTGQVGVVLARHFTQRGDQVVVLSRSPARASTPWPVVTWDGETEGPWVDELDGADVLINLAGRSVDCRYNAKTRREIKESRVRSTQVLGEALLSVPSPPRVWLQSSTATIYAHRFDAANDEATGILGGEEPDVPDTWRFSIDVAKSWERTADAFDLPRTRLVQLRSSMIMSPDADGVFDTLLGLVRKGLGGRAGNGRQYISWIHDADFIRAVDWLIEREDLDGAINVASPNPLPNAEFMRALRAAAGMPFGLPSTAWMLELGAIFLRTETELILKSRRVVPGRLEASGFRFEHPHWEAAAEDLCRRWRAERG